MKILANDGLEQIAITELTNLGHKVATNHLDGDILIKTLENTDVLIVRSATKVQKDLLERVKNTKLKLVIRAGVGIDNIDVEYASKIGIKVLNTPNSSSNAVAEYVIGAMIGSARFMPLANKTCKEGKWNKKLYQGMEIAGKTLGVIGFGRIGKNLAKKAMALGMDVIYFDEYMDSDLGKKVDFETLLKNADFITIHAPLVREDFISYNEFNIMKEDTTIINTSRGANIDEDALIENIKNGKLRAAYLDVFKKEPIANKELLKYDKIYLTPHIGGSTDEAQQGIAMEIVDIIKREFVAGVVTQERIANEN